MSQDNQGINITKFVIIFTLVVLGFMIFNAYHKTQEIKNREYPNEVTESHTEEAYEAALFFLEDKLDEDDEIYAHTLEITSRESEPEYQHAYQVKISGNYVLEGFQDQLGRSRVREEWKVRVEYVGPEDGEWNIEEKRSNWELIGIDHNLE